jgi:hypothetical protein
MPQQYGGSSLSGDRRVLGALAGLFPRGLALPEDLICLYPSFGGGTRLAPSGECSRI